MEGCSPVNLTELRTQTRRLLVVDDDAIVRETLREALHEAGYEVTVAASGEEAVQLVRSADFHLVFSDLMMPGMSGIDVCRQIAAIRPDLPIVLITGYGTVEIAREGLHFGAADFVSKPINLAHLPIVVERNLQRQRLQDQRSREHSSAVLLQAVEALVQALDIRDDSTARHSFRVAEIAVALGERMRLSPDCLYALRLAALLHDVGKIGIRDQVLLPPDRLDREETALMQEHPVKGAEILANIHELDEVVTAVRHHHENFDGSGYPDGLAGDAIPLLSRIIRVADAWDAMVFARHYRPGLPIDQARQHLNEGSGAQFDPAVISLFMKHLSAAPAAGGASG